SRRFDDMDRMTAAGDEYLGLEGVVVENLDDLLDEPHAVGCNVVEATDERPHERGAGLRRKQRLRRRKHQRDVDLDALARQRLAGAYAVAGERHFDNHPAVDLGDVVAFANHAGEVGRDHFAADWTVDDVADLLEVLPVIAWLFREQRWIGSDPIDNADRRERFDVLDVSTVNEEFHKRSLAISFRRKTGAYSFSTGFVRSPTPSTRTVTTSPACRAPTPDGVPVEIMSPGSSVITKVMYSTSRSIGKIS